MSLATLRNAYSEDLVTATDLNRSPGSILDRALEHPVTITRKDQSFALLPREQVIGLVKAAARGKDVFDVLNTALRVLLDGSVSSDHPYAWLMVLDHDELRDLICEIGEAYNFAVVSDQGWDQVAAVIHEWHESAIAMSSPDLASAYGAETDEVALTQPISEGASVS